MVLIHKIIQMQKSYMEDGHSDGEIESEASSEDPHQTIEVASKSTTSRPLTRSQTSSLPPSRRVEEVVQAVKTSGKRLREVDVEKKTSRRLKDRPSRKSSDDFYRATLRQSRSNTPPQATLASSGDVGATSSGQYTFLETSTMPVSDRRGPRARAAPPIPVPNLTKKSRGRRVPIQLTASDANMDGTSRVYVCKVENCGKCFNRGEHLKRHIRSIHTHEKPFKCTHAGCDKYFNRHDNLLQHLKVHKVRQRITGERSQSSSPVEEAAPLPIVHSDSPDDITPSFKPTATAISIALPHRLSYREFSPDVSSDLTSFASNMAVSSIRTQIPHSPTSAPTSPLRLHFTHVQASYERRKSPPPSGPMAHDESDQSESSSPRLLPLSSETSVLRSRIH